MRRGLRRFPFRPGPAGLAAVLFAAAGLHAEDFQDVPMPPLAAPHLGWMPVQPLPADRVLALDMRRFASLGPGQSLHAGPASPAGEAEISGYDFTLRVPPEVSGLVRVPVAIRSSDGRELRRGMLEVDASPRPAARFRFAAADSPPKKVAVAGSFNGWNTETHLLKPTAPGTFELVVPVQPGGLEYKFVVDGEWMHDPANPRRAENGNSVMEAGGPDGPLPRVYARERVPGALRFEAWGAVALAALAQLPDGSSHPLEISPPPVGEVSTAGLPPGAWVRVTPVDAHGRCGPPARAPVDEEAAFRWQDGVIYYAFTDRFANGDPSNDAPVPDDKVAPPANYLGGDFEGIRRRVEEGYFESLGVNVLWLAPLNQNPEWSWQEFQEPYRHYTGYHGYWPVSSTEVERRFGGEAALRALVGSAHGRGMKIIADLVLRHVHIEHPLWKQRRGWFGTLDLPDGRKNLRIWDEHQFTTWFEEWLPGFDFQNPAAVAFLLDNAIGWARRFELDGFRLDAVKHIHPEFWWKFRSALRAAIPDTREPPLYFVGETFMDRAGIMSFVGPNMLDGQFDFPLYDSIIEVLARGVRGFDALEESLRASESVYGKETLMSPLIGNHDKPRFLAYADGDMEGLDHKGEIEEGWRNPPRVDDPASYAKLRMALSFLMAVDGVPMIYYGDEVGMTGAGDPDNRRMMPRESALGEEEKRTLGHFRKVSALRRAHPALRYGSRRAVLVEPDRYAFVRRHFDDRVAVAWNRAGEPARIEIEVGPEFPDGPALEALGGNKLEVVGGKATLDLPPRSSAFLVPLSQP